MGMRRVAWLWSCALLVAVPMLAQSDIDMKRAMGGEPGNAVTGGCTAITDDGYDGTLGSMACINVPGPGPLTITDVTLDLGVNHTWVGDLTVKVVSPMGTVATMMSRPNFAEAADDGTGCCGASDNLVETSPVTYDDLAATSAESMGLIVSANVVCQDDGICDYSSAPDTAAGAGLADFIGEDADGTWMVCVGDSVAADLGEVCTANLNISGTAPAAADIPTVGYAGLGVLLLLLGVTGLWIMRRPV